MANEPLLRRRTPRSLIATLLFLAALGAMLVGSLWLAFGGSPVIAVAALVAVVALPLTIGPVDNGRWSEGRRGVGDRGVVVLVLALAVATTGFVLASGIAALADRDALGTPGDDIVPWFVLAAVALTVWSVGWVDDCLGLGDGQYLSVSFAGGRATEAALAYDEYGGAD